MTRKKRQGRKPDAAVIPDGITKKLKSTGLVKPSEMDEAFKLLSIFSNFPESLANSEEH